MNLKPPAMMALGLLWALPSAAVAQNTDQAFGSFYLPAGVPDTIQLNGDITPAIALDFKRALRARPDATVLDLASNGGDVLGALIVAFDVFERKMDTRIRAGAGCYSACAYLFLAGDSRKADGELGVHQVSGPGDVDLTAAQYTIAEIIQAMSTFGVDSTVVTTMFRTPPEAMYVFTRQEMAALSIEREGTTSTTETAASEAPALTHEPAGNVMVVAKSYSQQIPRSLDVVMPTTSPAAIAPTLERIGCTTGSAEQAAPVLASMLKADTIPGDAEIRVLFGPLSQESKVFVPYRISIYAGANLQHRATIALTDMGSYASSVEPVDADGVDQSSHLGKHDRRRQ